LDVEAARTVGYRRLMSAKTETPVEVSALADFGVVALCETPRGILQAEAIARATGIEALMWGAEDLVAGISGTSSRFPSGTYRDVVRHARATGLLAAAAAGRRAIDSVYLDLEDLGGLAAEAEDAAEIGFTVKACLHPTQIPVIRRAFEPTADQAAWARGLLAAAETSPDVIRFEGKMVGEPLLRQARASARRSPRCRSPVR
jgi:citrate lyase subunit beta/citryl-CoA lyase